MVRGKVSATYTYGKPVNGKVVLKFAVDNKQQTMYAGAYNFKEITIELVDGSALWEVRDFTLVWGVGGGGRGGGGQLEFNLAGPYITIRYCMVPFYK